MIVAPWHDTDPAADALAAASPKIHLNATQSSLNNIPFRNAQIVSKIISET